MYYDATAKRKAANNQSKQKWNLVDGMRKLRNSHACILLLKGDD